MTELEKAASKAREWTAKRNAIIRAERAAGKPLRAIAAEAGLSHTQIANLVPYMEAVTE